MTDPTPLANVDRQTTRLLRHLAYELFPRVVGRKPAEFVTTFVQNPERYVFRLYRKAVRDIGRPGDATLEA